MTSEQSIDIRGGELKAIDCRLKRESVVPGGASAELSIESRQRGTRVMLDGEPFIAGQVPAGRHRIEAHRAGFLTWHRDVELASGTKTEVEIVLSPEPEYADEYHALVRSRRRWGYAVGGGGTLLAASAVVLWLVNGNEYDEWERQKAALEAAPSGPDFERRLQRFQDQARLVERLNAWTVATGAAGGVLVVAGAALWLSAGDPDRYGAVNARIGARGPELQWVTSW